MSSLLQRASGWARAGIGATLLTLWSLPVFASGLSIEPLRLEFTPTHRYADVRLRNRADHPVTVETEVFAWTQPDGSDQLLPTRDVFVSPPIVTVPAGGAQTLRLRYLGPMPKDQELAYRLYLTEAAAPGSGLGISFNLRVGLPVLMSRADLQADPKTQLTPAGAGWRLNIANAGNAHLRVFGVDLFGAEATPENPGVPLGSVAEREGGMPYLLAGSNGTWPLPATAKATQIRVRTDRYGHEGQGWRRDGTLWLSLASAGTAR